MADPDPSLGITASFPADQFRSAIQFAMEMGSPPDSALRPVFVFASTGRTYRRQGVVLDVSDVRLDRDGKPLDPEIQVVAAAPATKQVDCAIEIQRADANELPVGSFRPTKAVVTLLDTQFAQVAGCRELLYAGDRYAYGYSPEVNGLFSVGIHTLIFYCLEDT